jgi:site-specific recombinase XerD
VIKTKYEDYLRGLNKSQNTIKAYRGDIDAFTETVKKPLQSLKDTDLSEYIGGLSGHCGASTRARKISALKSYFAFKVARGELKTNPAAELETPKREKRLPVHLSLDESRELLNDIEGKYAIRDRAILTLFLNCGLRLSELVGIDRSDIRGDTLRVIGKGSKNESYT